MGYLIIILAIILLIKRLLQNKYTHSQKNTFDFSKDKIQDADFEELD